ncbi:MAG TPA: hypothetical protein VKS80_03705 [Trinickia sp.]|nr:hypothetical protein [Trinickia sp.]
MKFDLIAWGDERLSPSVTLLPSYRRGAYVIWQIDGLIRVAVVRRRAAALWPVLVLVRHYRVKIGPVVRVERRMVRWPYSGALRRYFLVELPKLRRAKKDAA